MRKINGKLLVGLLVGTALLAGALTAAHFIQYQRIAQALLWQARRAEEQGQVERMTRYLSRYLEFNPRDDVEKAHLGSLWASDAFANAPRLRYRAIRLLDEVLTHDAGRNDLRRLLVKTALEFSGAPEIIKLARTHLEKLYSYEQVRSASASAEPAADHDRGECEGWWGKLLEAEHNADEAIRCYRLAVAHNPAETTSYVRLAYLLRRQESEPGARERNAHEADEWIDRLVTRNEAGHQAHLARWRYRRDFDLLELRPVPPAAGRVALSEARDDVTRALRRAPEDAETLLAAADLERLLAQADFDDEKLSGAQRERSGRQHRDQAYKLLEQGLKLQAALPPRLASDGAKFQLLWHKAGLLLDDLRRADARLPSDPSAPSPEEVRSWEQEATKTIDEVHKTRVSPAGVDFLQGRLLAHQHHWAEAAQLFEQARALLGSQADLAVQINLHLGLCYEQLEEPGQMFRAYEGVTRSDPDSVPALLGMAAAEWAMQRLDQAAQKYARLLALGRVPDRAWLDIARLEIQRQGEKDRPTWELAEQALVAAGKAMPGSVEVTLLKADMWLSRGDEPRARMVLDESKDNPRWAKEPALWAARADLELRGSRPERGGAILDEAEKAIGDHVTLRLARARTFAAQLKSDSPATDRQATRDRIDALAAGADRMPENDRGRLLAGLAHAHLQTDDLGAARQTWQRMVSLPRYRADLRLRLLLFDLALKMDDEPGMARALEDIRSVERRDGAFSEYGEALRLLWAVEKKKADRDKALASARVHLDHALNQRPNWAAVYLARARVHELEGNREQAIKDLREARANGDSSPEVIRQLAALLTERGQHQEAEEELRKLREPLLAADPDLGKLAARVALFRNDYAAAARRAQAAVRRPETASFRDLVFLGRVLAQSKPDEAEKHLRRAREIAPREPLVWIAWVQFLSAHKRGSEATRALDEARAALPADRAELCLAQCHEVLGRQKDALELYSRALQSRPNDAPVARAAANFLLSVGRMGDAEKLLRKLRDGGMDGATADDRDWARHGLALVLASSNDYSQFREALALEGLKLDANGQLASPRDHEDSTEQQKSQARVLATHPGQRQFRRRAIDMLENLERTRALLAADRFLLAVLYEADGAWRKSQAILAELTQGTAPNPRFLARYVQSLLMHEPSEEAIKEAERGVERLEELESQREVEANAFASIEMRARLLEARGQPEKALALLRRHVTRSSKTAQPEEALLVLDSLRRQKRFAEAYALCEEMWTGGSSLAGGKPCRPEVAGGASVAILRMMTPTDAQITRLEGRLKDAMTANPRSMVLLLHLADLYDLRGRYADAEALYRRVLDDKNEPRNVVALNNLAWLLAHRDGGASEALSHIEAAVNGIGRRPDLLDTRGLVYLKLGKHEQALADLKEANADSPTPTRQFHLARALYETRDRLAAVETLREAEKQLRPGQPSLPGLMHPSEQEECKRLLDELKAH